MARLLFAVLLLVACSAAPLAPEVTEEERCAQEAQVWSEEAKDIVYRLNDLTTLGSSTARIALVPIISDLQALRREAEALEPPACAQEANTALVIAIRETTDGFLAFAAQEPEGVVTMHFERVGRQLEKVTSFIIQTHIPPE